MKKILLTFCMSVFFAQSALASCEYSCVSPYDMNTKFRTVAGAIAGVNAITEKKAEAILKKEILSVGTAESLKVDVQSYSSRDLRNGIFKSVSVNTKNSEINEIHFSELNLRTLCDFNYITQEDGKLVVKEDIPLAFDAVMSPDDINATMKHKNYQKLINDLNSIGKSYGLGLKISSGKIAVRNRKLYYVLGFEFPFLYNEQRVVIESELRVTDGKINMNNTRLVSGNVNINLKRLDYVMNYLNPFEFSVNFMQNKNAKVNVKNVKIVGNNVVADGIIIIPKDK